MAIEGREFYGYLPQLYVDVTLPRWPSWQVSVVYTPIALENQGAAEHFFRHQAEAFHQLEPGVTLRHSVLPYLDVLASVRYPFILSEHRYLNYPTALVGFDYWIYRLSLGGRFGAAQFPSLESGYRLSAFSSLVVGVGL
jgi:hypothetical protein